MECSGEKVLKNELFVASGIIWNILLTHWFLQVLDAAPGEGFWQDPLEDEAVADPEIDNL